MTYKEIWEIISEIVYVVFLTLLVLFGLHII
jgi:hypothetical protein